MNEHIADQRHLKLVDDLRSLAAQVHALSGSTVDLAVNVYERLMALEERCDEQLVMIDVLNTGLVDAHQRIELLERWVDAAG